jgi:hypothetical protein
VLREFSWADDVRDCRERTVRGLGVEIIEAETREAFLEQWRAWCGILVLREPGEGVVVEVVGVLVDAPGDTGLFVELGSGFPFFGVAVEAASFAACDYLV